MNFFGDDPRQVMWLIAFMLETCFAIPDARLQLSMFDAFYT